jgi:hypothetical protein
MNPIQNYLEASKALLSQCINDIQAEDAEAFQGIAHAMQQGSYCEIRTCLSVIGANEVLINIVQANGDRINLGHIEFDVAPPAH